MKTILRARLSLDGRLVTASGKPSGRGIAVSRLKAAMELRLRILPVILGGKDTPTLSGMPGSFLPDDLHWELISSGESCSGEGELVLRYRRIPLKGKLA